MTTRKKLNLDCPEVNGVLACLEELVDEGQLDELEAGREAARFAAEHSASSCRYCGKSVREKANGQESDG